MKPHQIVCWTNKCLLYAKWQINLSFLTNFAVQKEHRRQMQDSNILNWTGSYRQKSLKRERRFSETIIRAMEEMETGHPTPSRRQVVSTQAIKPTLAAPLLQVLPCLAVHDSPCVSTSHLTHPHLVLYKLLKSMISHSTHSRTGG